MNQKYIVTALAFMASLQAGCATNSKLALQDDGSPRATMELKAFVANRYDSAFVKITGGVVCETRLFKKLVYRKGQDIVRVRSGSSTAIGKLPAGKDQILLAGESIGDRSGGFYFQMFVKPDAQYKVVIMNDYKDKFLFGSYASQMNVSVTENGVPVNIIRLDDPTEADCPA